MDKNINEDNRETPLKVDKPSPSTPIDGVVLSAPQQPPYCQSLIDVGSELDDECSNSDAINYASDGNVSSQATLIDR